MRLTRFGLILFFLPAAAFAQKQQIAELQRDLGQLQTDVKTLQRTIDEKMAALTTLVQQALETSQRANTAFTSQDGAMREMMRRQQEQLSAPVAALGTKIDQLASDFSSVRESVADVSTRMGKLDQKVTDLSNQKREIPVPTPGASAPTAGMPAPPSGPPPGMRADTVYSSALADKVKGNTDLALQGFQDYLKYYGTSEFAANAQYYIGEISYNKSEFEPALQAFDAVLERYPENTKTADARLMKGRTLVKLGQNQKAAQEFRDVASRYANREQGTKAVAELRSLGVRPTSAPTPKRRR